MNENGLIHLYFGDGKGKTTAAMGLALRCAGRGGKVVIAQFLKDGTSGECLALAKMENVTLLAANPSGKFTFQMSGEEKNSTREAICRTFEAAAQYARKEKVRLLVLDEVCAAVSQGFLDEDELLCFLEHKPEALEVVLTGRNPSERLMRCADYVTEMKKHRHPFERGIAAREGIEY